MQPYQLMYILGVAWEKTEDGDEQVIGRGRGGVPTQKTESKSRCGYVVHGHLSLSLSKTHRTNYFTHTSPITLATFSRCSPISEWAESRMRLLKNGDERPGGRRVFIAESASA